MTKPMTLSAGGDKLAVRKPPVDGFLAGILEDGVVTVIELVTRGLDQGSVASAFLAKLSLHYVFDLWAKR